MEDIYALRSNERQREQLTSKDLMNDSTFQSKLEETRIQVLKYDVDCAVLKPFLETLKKFSKEVLDELVIQFKNLQTITEKPNANLEKLWGELCFLVGSNKPAKSYAPLSNFAKILQVKILLSASARLVFGELKVFPLTYIVELLCKFSLAELDILLVTKMKIQKIASNLLTYIKNQKVGIPLSLQSDAAFNTFPKATTDDHLPFFLNLAHHHRSVTAVSNCPYAPSEMTFQMLYNVPVFFPWFTDPSPPWNILFRDTNKKLNPCSLNSWKFNIDYRPDEVAGVGTQFLEKNLASNPVDKFPLNTITMIKLIGETKPHAEMNHQDTRKLMLLSALADDWRRGFCGDKVDPMEHAIFSIQPSGTTVIFHAFIQNNDPTIPDKSFFISEIASFDISNWEDYVGLVIFNLQIRESWRKVVDFLSKNPGQLLPKQQTPVDNSTAVSKKRKNTVDSNEVSTSNTTSPPVTQVGDTLNTQKHQYEVTAIVDITNSTEVIIAYQKPHNLTCFIKKYLNRDLYRSCFPIYMKLKENPHERITKLIDCTDDNDDLDMTNAFLVFKFFHFTRDWFPQHPKDLQSFSRQLLQGLAHLEKLGIVHGDISPSNVLWNQHEQKLLLVDFDHAKKFDKEKFIPHTFGTPGFYSPEVYSDGKLTRTSDIYQAGLLLILLAKGSMNKGHPTSNRFFLEMVNTMTSQNHKERSSASSLLNCPYFELEPLTDEQPFPPNVRAAIDDFNHQLKSGEIVNKNIMGLKLKEIFPIAL